MSQENVEVVRGFNAPHEDVAQSPDSPEARAGKATSRLFNDEE